MRYGLPAWLMLVGLMGALIWAVAQRKGLPEPWRRARHAWAFTLFGITVAAATVQLWNAVFVPFIFLIGAGAWLLDARPDVAARATAYIRKPITRLVPVRLF